MRDLIRLRAPCLAALFSSAFALSPAGAIQIDVIAVEGDLSPDGVTHFDSFPHTARTQVNDLGVVHFQSILDDGGDGLYAGTGGAVFTIARTGLDVPGIGAVDEISLGWEAAGLADAAFVATLSGTIVGVNDDAVYRARLGIATEIAREGDGAPDGNGILSGFSGAAINSSGQVATTATLIGTTGGTGTDDNAVYRGDGGPLTTIVRTGDLAPDGVFVGVSMTSMNESGLVGIDARFIDDATGFNEFGLYTGDGTTLNEIMRTGDAMPDGNGSIGGGTGERWVDGAGRMGFWALLTGTNGGSTDDQAILIGDGGPLTTIVRTGQAASDGNGVLSDLIPSAGGPLYSQNGNGDFGFVAQMTGTTGGAADDTAVFLGNGVASVLLAREGDAAPDANGFFGDFGRAPAVNSSGQAAFAVGLTGTNGGASDDAGLFIADDQEVVDLVRKGDTVGGAALTEITLFAHSPAGSALNEFGQVAFFGRLATGERGVFLATPELHWRAPGSGAWENSDNWTVGLDPAAPHPVFIDPDATIIVDGPEGNTTIKSLTIGAGNPDGIGIPTLHHNQPVELRVEETLTIHQDGVLINEGAALTAGFTRNSGRFLHNSGNLFLEQLINEGLMEIRSNAFVVFPTFNEGVLNVHATGELGSEFGIVNSGEMNVEADVIAPLTNLTGGSVNFFGSDSSLQGPLDNFGNVVVDGVAVELVGLVTNDVTGTIKNTAGTIGFRNGFINNGAYISDPADNEFTDITFGTTGYLAGGAGDRFIVSGDFVSSSLASANWETLAAELIFEGGGAHVLGYTGEDRGADLVAGRDDNFAWGRLALASGDSLALQGGGAIYVTVLGLADGLSQIAAITSDGTVLYYDANAAENAWLGGQDYALAGGGAIAAAVPEPSVALLWVLGMGWMLRRRRGASDVGGQNQETLAPGVATSSCVARRQPRRRGIRTPRRRASRPCQR